MKIEETLKERQKTHGDFSENAKIAQALKDAVRMSSKFNGMNEGHKEAVDAILCKVARVVVGNPFEPDHWRDIAGYATLGGDCKEECESDACKEEIVICEICDKPNSPYNTDCMPEEKRKYFCVGHNSEEWQALESKKSKEKEADLSFSCKSFGIIVTIPDLSFKYKSAATRNKSCQECYYGIQ